MIRVRTREEIALDSAEEMLEEMVPGAMRRMKEALLLLESRAKLMLSRPGRGRIYTHRFVTINGRPVPMKERPTPHQASAPGDPPAVDDGRLRGSITHEGPTRNGWTIEGEWGTNVEYADDLEYGTSRVMPRPWARPTEILAEHDVDALLELP